MRASEGGEVGEAVIRSCDVRVSWESEELYRHADEGRVDGGRSRGWRRRHCDGKYMTGPQQGGKEDGKAGHGYLARGAKDVAAKVAAKVAPQASRT